MGSRSSSSSGEEDGPAEWREAVESIAATTTFGIDNGSTTTAKSVAHSASNIEYGYENDQQHKPHKLKHYHIKAQKLLDEILDKSLEMTRDVPVPDNDQVINEGVLQLFKHSPPGIVFDHIDELKGPKKKPRILPGQDIDMKSKQFKRQLRSVVVDGVDVLATARDACQKALVRQEAKDAAAKEKAKKEEERVAELKRIRGERWLPSIASEMQMAMLLVMVVDGLSLFVSTVWSLQERRFSSTFEAVSSAAVSLTMALVVCFLSTQSHSRGDMFLPFI
ncbi:hypothetical protein KPL71_020025 [Citrus sinensis]|uniref:Uncharacterized protein n=1 Tax=Citrus sinensis TaxID=2711 RepID=A0ACB8J4A7_CITSI|nr:hypothetical protein KPL71_020025 [Citrus sinensis]